MGLSWKKNSGFWRQVICTCIVFSSYGLIGITRGYVSFLLDQLKSPGTEIAVTSDQESWIASLNIFPNPFGSVLIGFLMDIFGRKPSLNISMACFTVGWAIIASANSVLQLYVGNIILGVATGMSLCTSVYVAEICEQHLRCTLLSLFIILYAAGTCISYVLTGYLSWRLSATIFLFISFLASVFAFFIVESPYWYLKKGRTNAAISVLRKLRDDKDDAVESECQDILYNLNSRKDHRSVSVKTLLRHWKPFLILFTFQICLQGSGYSVLVTYFSRISGKLNADLDTKLLAVGYSCMIFVSALFSPFVIQFCSRKSVMKISSSGMTFSMAMLLIYKLCNHLDSYDLADWLVPIALYLYVFTCVAGAVTISESMAGELFPTEVRGVMCGTLQAFSTTITGLCIKLFPILEFYSNIVVVVSIFTCFSFLLLLFSVYILPETRGKNLEQIQAEL